MSPRSRYYRNGNYNRQSPHGPTVNIRKKFYKQFQKQRKEMKLNNYTQSYREPYPEQHNNYGSMEHASYLTNDMTKGLQVIVYRDEKEVSMISESSSQNNNGLTSRDSYPPRRTFPLDPNTPPPSFHRNDYPTPSYINISGSSNMSSYEPSIIHAKEYTPDDDSITTIADDISIKTEVFTFPQPLLTEAWCNEDGRDHRKLSSVQDKPMETVSHTRQFNLINEPGSKITCDSSSQTSGTSMENMSEFHLVSEPLRNFQIGMMKVASDFESSLRRNYKEQDERQPSKDDIALLQRELSALKNIVLNLTSVIVNGRTTDHTQANNGNS